MTGKTVRLPVNSAGNFFYKDGSLTPPIQAKVVAGGTEIAMKLPVPTGDCNSCHTEQGLAGAPGRIVLP